MRHLIVILGDQLNEDSAAFDDFDATRDAIWMAEVAEESQHVWSHKARIAVFFAAMRHFRDAMKSQSRQVHYLEIDANENPGSFSAAIGSFLAAHTPEKVVLVEPGEWRVREVFQEVADEHSVPLELREDRHFLCSVNEFRDHAEGRKQLRMEFFYREMRKRYGWLMTADNKPEGGDWNYDSENRQSLNKQAVKQLPGPVRFPPDTITKQVLDVVQKQFPDHPGSLDSFDWPVTRAQALQALDDFVRNRLARFGDYQDAMWTDRPWVYHSCLSAALNLKLLDPREVIAAAEQAYQDGNAPLNAVEGFIRQIGGWREYVRGIYWNWMPEYLERNALNADRSLPEFYWTGETEMACLQQAIRQTLELGYAHHIQRLMVTGLFAMLLGVHPFEVHRWYLAVYVDAIEWVELPNTLGMSQFGDGGVMASKPYAATGKYIHRMSNYCSGCRFKPDQATGENACPFTTLYWDFLQRHRQQLEAIPRMKLQVRNLDRKSPNELKAIRRQAKELKQRLSEKLAD